MDLYFSYGIEMNAHFMHSICPQALFFGIGVCYHYCFQTNSIGLADIQPSHYSKLYGVVWKIYDRDIASLTEWAQDYFPNCIKHDAQSIELIPSAQNEHLQFPNVLNPIELKAFFFHSRNGNAKPPLKDYMKAILKELQNLEIPQDYISELRLWISS
jgi:hypothetical protein